MTSARPRRVTVVAHGDTVHHRRFVRAIVGRGHRVTTVRWDDLRSSVDPESALVAALADSMPDVVLAGPVPTVAADVLAATDKPVVVTSWGSDLLVDAQHDREAGERATFALRRAAAVLVDSRTVARAAEHLGAPADRIVRFPWGVDLDEHHWCPVPPLGDRLNVVSLRRLEPNYRVEVLIEAVAQVPGLHLEVLGDGSAAAGLRRRAAALGVAHRVSFAGLVEERATVNALRAAHLHVSTSPMDGTSISLLQALAVGRPSIVVDNPSNREWVEHGVTGWLTPAGDPEALAEVLRGATAGSEALQEISQRGRVLVEREADWSVHAESLCDTIESVAASR